MKYAVIAYYNKYLSLNGKDSQNMGDWVQTLAMEKLFSEWGIDNYEYVSRNNTRTYDGESVVLPYNSFNTLIPSAGYRTDSFPVSDKIRPVFLSFHYHDRYISEEFKEQLIKYGPVGCRDEETFNNMKAHNIPSYLSGCVTALFDKREPDKERYKRIFFVDTPEDIIKYVPDDIREKIEFKTNAYKITRTEGDHYMTMEEADTVYNATKESLKLYKDYAALIVTSRLHIASPCMAMGIPVVLVKEDFDGRFAWIDKYLPLYSKEKWKDIDWNSNPVDLEKEKILIKNVLKELIIDNDRSRVDEIDRLYKNRERYEYNCSIKNSVRSLLIDTSKYTKYAVWGIVAKTLIVTNAIDDVYESMDLSAAYDMSVKGQFEGIDIKHPDEIDFRKDTIYFVIASKAFDDARTKFTYYDCKYVLVNMYDYSYETNLGGINEC